MKVYFIKIALRGVSPMVWHRSRLCPPGIALLARLHNCIQIINGWDDFHLSQFRIFGKDYGVDHRCDKSALSDTQNKVLDILAKGKELNVNELYEQLDAIGSLRAVKADLSFLKKTGLIEQVGNGKLSLWRIKK